MPEMMKLRMHPKLGEIIDSDVLLTGKFRNSL